MLRAAINCCISFPAGDSTEVANPVAPYDARQATVFCMGERQCVVERIRPQLGFHFSHNDQRSVLTNYSYTHSTDGQ